MKKVWKIVLCVALIAVCLLGLAAKYDTRGAYPGMDVAEFVEAVGEQNLTGGYSYYCYRNTFGRTVLARVTTDYKYDFKVYRNLYDRYGSVVLDVRTVRPGIATHWDFLNLRKKMISLYELVANAGMPAAVSNLSGSFVNFDFETVDGYCYTVRLSSTVLPSVVEICTPDGQIYQEEELEAFQRKVEWFYIGLLGALIMLLIGMLTVPAAIRRRKTGEKAKSCDRWELLKNGCCVLLVLIVLIGYDAKYQTHGAYAGMEYDTTQKYLTMEALGEEAQLAGDVMVFQNGYGKIVVAQSLTVRTSVHWTRKVFNSIGRIAMGVQTTWGGIPTHLDFFNGERSIRIFTELVRDAGMPETNPNGPGWAEFAFTTVDQYTYIVRVGDGMTRVLGMWTPDGKYLCDETFDAFTVKVLVQYLVLAAILSCALVVLLTVPNAVRKRKEKMEKGKKEMPVHDCG